VTLQANATGATSRSDKAYLDINTIYCRAKPLLASYLKFVQARDMAGLNLMVETGECDFTAEDKKIEIQSYRLEKIGNTSVVEFQWKHKTLWTFEKLLLSSKPK